MFPIMLVLCYNMNNINVKNYCLNVLLESTNLILAYYSSIMHNISAYYTLNYAGIFDGGLMAWVLYGGQVFFEFVSVVSKDLLSLEVELEPPS